MAPAILGYWKIRGLAQAIRFALEYADVEYEEVRYEFAPPPRQRDDSEWMKVKYTLGLELPNLPYYMDDDVKLSETNAILLHIARKHDLYASSEQGKSRIDMVLSAISDVRSPFGALCYRTKPEAFDSEKEKFEKHILPGIIGKLEAMVGEKEYASGENKPSVADFSLYEYIYILHLLSPACISKSPKLMNYMKKISGLQPIAKYLKSSKYIERPVNGAIAIWK